MGKFGQVTSFQFREGFPPRQSPAELREAPEFAETDSAGGVLRWLEPPPISRTAGAPAGPARPLRRWELPLPTLGLKLPLTPPAPVGPLETSLPLGQGRTAENTR